MRFELLKEPAAAQYAAAIRRIVVDRTQWRVLIETWHEDEAWWGRLVFQPDPPVHDLLGPRAGPVSFRGSTREEVVAAAHEVPEHRLRVVLRSLT